MRYLYGVAKALRFPASPISDSSVLDVAFFTLAELDGYIVGALSTLATPGRISKSDYERLVGVFEEDYDAMYREVFAPCEALNGPEGEQGIAYLQYFRNLEGAAIGGRRVLEGAQGGR